MEEVELPPTRNSKIIKEQMKTLDETIAILMAINLSTAWNVKTKLKIWKELEKRRATT